MTRLISGKIKKTPSANADPNRYSWLDLQNAEPDLGVPSSNGSLFVSSTTGTRSWSNTITISGTVATINTLQVTGNTTVGNITATNLSFSGGALTLASNSNIKIGGGAPGQFLVSDGTNNLFWSSAAISVASGISNEQSSVAIVAPNGNITMSVAGTVGVVSVSNAGAVVTGNISVTGNITSNTGVFTGNGSGLSAIAGANVTGTVANATTSVTAGTVTTNAQPNITSVGTLTGLSVNGNITAANITANTGIFTGNGSGLSAIAGANVTGTVSSATTATTAGTVTANTQSNITSIGTLTSLVVGGNANVTGNLVTGGTINSAGNITAPFVFANVIGNVSGNITVSGSNGEVLYNKEGNSGTSNAFSFNDASNVLTVTGNINANFFTGNGSALSSITGSNVTGAVAFATTANSVAGANVTGTVASATTATTAGSATTAGTVTTNAQPNVTSVGTLTGLGVNGNIIAANITANTGVFTGNGSGLSAIAGANVTGTVASATTAGTVTTNAQPNITSVGTLTSLGVNGNITAANITANTGVITGNGSGLSAIAGANVTGTVPSATTATTAGTVTTNAQPNITSVGTLTSLAVTGNVSGGNLTTGGVVSATGNVSGGNLTTTGVLSVAGTGVSSIAGNLDMTSNTIINLATPTNANDAATKQYVDDVAQGLHTHDSCNAATDTTLATISGGTVTYNNGTSGVGATLTTTGSYTTIDGVTLSNGMRILVKNEANTAHNGIYDRTSTTVLTRSSDFDTPTEMAGGDFTFVTAGTLYDNTGWVMTDPVTTVGTTPVLWVQFSGAGTYTAGTGLTLTGSQFSVNASQTQVTSVGTLTGLTVGNATANTVFGNGTINSTGNITALTFFGNLVGNISGNIVVPGSNTQVLFNNQGNAGTSSAFTFNSASNVLTVTGNVSGGNIIATGYNIRSVGTGISAAGTTQGTATAITKEMNVVSTVVSGAGVILPTAVAGMVISITNTSANTVLVYPHSGGDINGAATNVAYSHSAGATLQYIAPTTTDWYTVGATYA